MVTEKIVLGQYEEEEYHVLELEVQEYRGKKLLDVDLISNHERSETFEIYPNQAKELIKVLKSIL